MRPAASSAFPGPQLPLILVRIVLLFYVLRLPGGAYGVFSGKGRVEAWKHSVFTIDSRLNSSKQVNRIFSMQRTVRRRCAPPGKQAGDSNERRLQQTDRNENEPRREERNKISKGNNERVDDTGGHDNRGMLFSYPAVKDPSDVGHLRQIYQKRRHVG